MCDCGCNTCETNSTLMLNESLAPRDILSEGLKYHMDANKPLTEHLYRAGSDNYFNLWAEARSLYSRNILEITHEDDLAVLTETDLGHFGMFEGKKVPLDFPIEINEIEDEKFVKGIELLRSTLSKEGGAAGLEPLVKALSGLGFSKDEVVDLIKNNINIKQHRDGDYILLPLEEDYNPDQEQLDDEDEIFMPMDDEGRPLDEAKKYKKGDKLKVKLKNGKEFDITFDSYSSNKGIAYGKIDGDRKPFSLDAVVSEAKAKKKKGPKLNKPMRDSSGGKAYKVYVKDPKTKKIKTVRFGSGGLRAKINDKKARNAFAKRHKCSTKKDKTKAGYWSCRLPRYAKLLGLKSNFGGFW